jgi:DNA-binding NarL/FixJ family response regulator
MKQISVLLADDHAIVREGFRTLLEDEADIEVIGEAKNGRQAVQLTQKLHPDVVLMDIAMPLLNGLEATRIILQTLPRTKVLILSAHGDDAYVEQASEMGAAGYLLKHSFSQPLPDAIRDVQKGRTVFCPSTAKRLRGQQSKHNQRGVRRSMVGAESER